MKDYLIFVIFLYLLKNKKTTAKLVAHEFNISERSVYRFIDSLCLMGVPLVTKQGRRGGIELVGEFYLENMLLNSKDKEYIKNFIYNGTDVNKVKSILEKFLN